MAGIADPTTARDVAPLVAPPRSHRPSPSSNNSSSFLQQHKKCILIAVGAAACATSLYLYQRDSSIVLGGDVECKPRGALPTPPGAAPAARVEQEGEEGETAVEKVDDPCPAICSAHRASYLTTKWSDDDATGAHTSSAFDPLSIDHLTSRVDAARKRTIASLQVDYGDEYYNKLFANDDVPFGNGSGGKNIGRYGFWGAGRAQTLSQMKTDTEEGKAEKLKLEHGELEDVSRKRYVRRMMMKVLKVQLSVTEDLSEVGEGKCDCISVPGTGDDNEAEAEGRLRERRRAEATAAAAEATEAAAEAGAGATEHWSDVATGQLRRRAAEGGGDEATANNDGDGEDAPDKAKADDGTAAKEDEKEAEEQPQPEHNTPDNNNGPPGKASKQQQHRYDTVVVTNGGHSSAAGHGNLFSESYTAVLQRTASPVYSAVGLDLIGRNHAMGGMSSASELALCSEAVYGTDSDVITWNFGMTDGRNWFRRKLYGQRRGVNQNRPLLMDLSTGLNPSHVGILAELESQGLASVICRLDTFVEKGGMKELIPDMAALSSEEEINKVPPFVQHLRCGNDIEKGDPTCGKQKYNDAYCPNRKFKASWHPGWKEHALRGNVIALFMIEVLVDALAELRVLLHDETLTAATTKCAAGERLHRERILSQLQAEEDRDYLKFHQSYVPTIEPGLWDEEIAKSVPLSLLYRGKAACHTAILPAMTRYQRIFDNDPQPDRLGVDNFLKPFEMGLTRRDADAREASPNGPMQLSYDDGSRQACEVPLTIDFKDYFLVRQVDGESFLTVPNEAEEDAYLDGDRSQLKGVVVVCFVKCDWGKCPGGMLNWDQVADGNATMAVNNVPVTGFHRMDECAVLRRDVSNYYFPRNADGRFEVMAKANQENSYLRITSVIVM